MKEYKAILFAPDGDWVTDFTSSNIEGVIEKLCNRGSLWWFYPFEGIIVDHGTTTSRQFVVNMAPPFHFLKGKSIKTISTFIGSLPLKNLKELLGG